MQIARAFWILNCYCKQKMGIHTIQWKERSCKGIHNFSNIIFLIHTRLKKGWKFCRNYKQFIWTNLSVLNTKLQGSLDYQKSFIDLITKISRNLAKHTDTPSILHILSLTNRPWSNADIVEVRSVMMQSNADIVENTKTSNTSGKVYKWNQAFSKKHFALIVIMYDHQRQSQNDQYYLKSSCGVAWSYLDWFTHDIGKKANIVCVQSVGVIR